MLKRIATGLLRIVATDATQQIMTAVFAAVLLGTAIKFPDERVWMASAGVAAVLYLVVQLIARAYRDRFEAYRIRSTTRIMQITNFGRDVVYRQEDRFRARHSQVREYTTTLRWTGRSQLAGAIKPTSPGYKLQAYDEEDSHGDRTGLVIVKCLLTTPVRRFRTFRIAFEAELHEQLGQYEPIIYYNSIIDCHTLFSKLEYRVETDDTVVIDANEAKADVYRTAANREIRPSHPLRRYRWQHLKKDSGLRFVQRPIEGHFYYLQFPLVPRPKSGDSTDSAI